MKQTAVEWFAKEIIKKCNISLFEYPDIYEKAREMEIKQQERMYSEEEVKQAYCEGAAEVSRYYDNGPFIDKNEWFKQFKKK